MPVMDGFRFPVEYEKLPDIIKKFCKVIVLSSSISADDINRASTKSICDEVPEQATERKVSAGCQLLIS